MHIGKSSKVIILSSLIGLVVFSMGYIGLFQLTLFIYGPVERPGIPVIRILIAAVLSVVAGIWVLYRMEKKNARPGGKLKNSRK